MRRENISVGGTQPNAATDCIHLSGKNNMLRDIVLPAQPLKFGGGARFVALVRADERKQYL